MDRIGVTRANGICTIMFQRPDRLNAIDDAMTRHLTSLFDELASDDETKVVVLAGQGKHFSAGGDIGNIASFLAPDPQMRHDRFVEAVQSLSKPLALSMLRVPQPVIASVRGHAIGVALQLVLMADLVVASETARFSLPQLDLAHTPDHGESWALLRKIGLSRTLQMSLMAERIDAATAERYGMVNWVVADDALEDRTYAVATRIATSPPAAARGAKALFHAGQEDLLAQALDRETATLGKVVMQQDFVEAITAFAEKRPPVFSGRQIGWR